MSMNTFMASIDKAMLSADMITQTVLSPEEQKLQLEREERAAKIDAYYARHDLPLEGYGMKMVLEAEKYGVDWRLAPALAMRETTGGKFACHNNPYGWGSCKIKFESFDQAIETVIMNLGGHNPRTARYYKGKTVRGILETYNPPSVVPTYADEVLAIMNKIDSIKL